MKEKLRMFTHGEVVFRELPETTETPKDWLPAEAKADGTVVVGDSETTGNYHVVQGPPGTFSVLQDPANERNFQVKAASEGVEVNCVIADRHDPIPLPPGNWAVTPAQEVDHTTNMVRQVAD